MPNRRPFIFCVIVFLVLILRSHAGAQVSLRPNPVSFGNQALGSTSTPATVTLTNNQTVPLNLSGIATSGDFAQTNSCIPSGSTTGVLPPATSCAIQVTFTPTVLGWRTGTLSVSDDASSSPQTVSLNGNAVVPVSLTPKSVTFGTQAIGLSSAPVNITLTNNQNVALNISGVTTSPDFPQTNTCIAAGSNTGAVAAGGSCTISVTFAPTSTGYKTATLAVSDDANGSPQTVSLSGNAVVPVTVSPSTLAFGNQSIRSSSAPQVINVTNNENVTLSISSITVGTSDFSQTSTCIPSGSSGGSLAPGGTCTISVIFSPASLGWKSTLLSINDNASSSPQTVTLTGNSFDPVTVSPKSVTFSGNQAVGTSSAATNITVSNNQTVALNISGIAASGDFSQTNTCIPSGSSRGALGAGANCTVSVTFSPTAIGWRTGTLTLTDDASTSPQTVNLAGNAVSPVGLSPKIIFFPDTTAGTFSVPIVVTVTNNENISLTMTGISVTGEYSQTNNCIPSGSTSGSVSAGGSCWVSIVFNPLAVGYQGGLLTVAYQGFQSPQSVGLNGNGITNVNPITVTVTPQGPCLAPNESVQFAAQVQNASGTSVIWSVDGVNGGTSASGFITSGGMYTAPPVTGSHNVRATSVASPSHIASSAVSVGTNLSVEVFPQVASIPVGGVTQFTTLVCGTANTSVNWTVDSIPGGSAATGTITAGGLYAAPGNSGTHRVRAVSVVDNTKGYTAKVNVYSSVTVDFGSRNFTTYPIPSDMFGVGRGESLHNPADISLLTSIGFKTSRTYAQIPTVWATPTPNWTIIDPIIAKLQNAGLRPILQMAYTPPWLQPNPNPCPMTATNAVPTNISTWAQIAAAYVAHMDQVFPGFITDYEIWNEPNGQTLCSNNKLADYSAIYAAAAPAMKAQAQTDGFTIRIGGPALTGYDATFLTSFLTNPSTAPYIDFISYHEYFNGAANINAQWDVNVGATPLYEKVQDAYAGMAAIFIKAEALLKNGQQPAGANTPVYIDEYNTNWAYLKECCRNDPTYAPLFNALFVADGLNAAYAGAQQVPGKLVYFAGNAFPYFCLIGIVDTNMDCSYPQGSTPQPYPQYYAYDLFAGPNYLGLSNAGGFMAQSVAPPTGQYGIVVTAFYTPALDGIVIVNPTSTDYNSLTVNANNTGYTSPTGTQYLLNSGNPTIASAPVSLTPTSGGVSLTMSVPHYSVVAISLTGP